MNDDEFDQLLQKAGSTATVKQATLDGLVERSRDARGPRRARKPVVIAVAVAGAVLLAAAATSEQ